MKKFYLFFILILVASFFVRGEVGAHLFTQNGSSYSENGAVTTSCGTKTQHGKTHYGVPVANNITLNGSFGKSGTLNCNYGLYYPTGNTIDMDGDSYYIVYNQGDVTTCDKGDMVIGERRGWRGRYFEIGDLDHELGRGIICKRYDNSIIKGDDLSITSVKDKDTNVEYKNKALPAGNYRINFDLNYKVNGHRGTTDKNSLSPWYYSKIKTVTIQFEKPDKSTWSETISMGNSRLARHSFYYDFEFTNVDNDLSSGNYRTYTVKITELCDEAGNCLKDFNQAAVFNFDVYANPELGIDPKDGTKVESKILNPDVADGQEKKIEITLKDKHGNKILPVNIPAQNNHNVFKRNLTFKANYNNSVLRDQYKYCQSGNSCNKYNANVKANTGILTTNFYNEAANIGKTNCNGGTNTNCNLEVQNNQIIQNIFDYTKTVIKDGKYTLGIIPYAPTYDENATDGRQYAIDGAFSIGQISVRLSDKTIDDILKTEVDNFQFKPRFITKFSGSLADNGFVVGARQNSKIEVSLNSGELKPTKIWLEFGYFVGDGKVYDNHKAYTSGADLTLYFNRDCPDDRSSCTISNEIISGYQKDYKKLTDSQKEQTANFFTNLIQIGTLPEYKQKTYLATFIQDKIDDVTVIYPSAILGADRYTGNADSVENTFQRPLKIIGNAHSLYYSKTLKDEQNEEIKLMGDIEKVELQKNVRKRVTDNMTNLTYLNNIQKFGNISLKTQSNASNNLEKAKIIGDTIYINANGKNIEIGDSAGQTFSGTNNIVIYGGNAEIIGNLKAIDKNKDLLSIIVIEDPKTGKGGDIYINPRVTRLESILYADKSITSYANGKILSPNDGGTYEVLKNQLHIYGSIFSNNTIGGSIEKNPICPYYVKENCTIDVAQKYDLYNLRRGFENITTDKTAKEYAVIIEYNPLIQQKTPEFLKTN